MFLQQKADVPGSSIQRLTTWGTSPARHAISLTRSNSTASSAGIALNTSTHTQIA
jgi:hypothetical protein